MQSRLDARVAALKYAMSSAGILNTGAAACARKTAFPFCLLKASGGTDNWGRAYNMDAASYAWPHLSSLTCAVADIAIVHNAGTAGTRPTANAAAVAGPCRTCQNLSRPSPCICRSTWSDNHAEIPDVF